MGHCRYGCRDGFRYGCKDGFRHVCKFRCMYVCSYGHMYMGMFVVCFHLVWQPEEAKRDDDDHEHLDDPLLVGQHCTVPQSVLLPGSPG